MKSAQDNCGVFGLYSSNPCVLDIYQGIDFLQHRGQKYCGLSVFDGKVRQVTHHDDIPWRENVGIVTAYGVVSEIDQWAQVAALNLRHNLVKLGSIFRERDGRKSLQIAGVDR